MTQENKTSPYKRTLLKSSAFLIAVILGFALSLAGIFNDRGLSDGFISFCFFVVTPTLLYVLFQKSTLHVFNANMFLVIVCTLFFVVAWDKKPIPKPILIPQQVQVKEVPQLSEREKKVADRKWPYNEPDKSYITDPVKIYCKNYNVYQALISRANTEIGLANLAYQSGDDVERRQHLQRASDYKLAAEYHCEKGEFPPGFDADLATK